jgi:hypothetical protein
MKEPVVSAHGDSRTAVEQADNASGWKYLFVIGIALAVIGFINLALLFFPPRWASLDWEFGTLSGIVDGLPLVTIGVGAMCAAAVANGWVLTRRLMALLTILMALLMAVVGVMFALDVFAVLKVVQPAMKPTIKLAAVKTSLSSLTYFALYLALGVWTWRRLRGTKGARG